MGNLKKKLRKGHVYLNICTQNNFGENKILVNFLFVSTFHITDKWFEATPISRPNKKPATLKFENLKNGMTQHRTKIFVTQVGTIASKVHLFISKNNMSN